VTDGDHDLTDVSASILDHFGLPPLPGMVGRSFLPAPARAGSSEPATAGSNG
jgi:hypothetical protein